MGRDRPLHLIRRAILIGASLFVILALWAASHSSTFVESIYARHIGAWITEISSRVSGLIPISLAEFALAGVVLYVIVPLVLAIANVARRRRRVSNALAGETLRLITFGMLVLAVAYAAWGLNYARVPLASRLGWAPIPKPTNAAESDGQTQEIMALASDLVMAGNASYHEFAGSDDLGRPSSMPGNIGNLDATLEAAYARVQERLSLEPALASRRGPVKSLIASVAMSHLQLTGFYFPWTGEANVNRLAPAATLPHTIAHEKAHQRGVAREDEANFIGFVACIMSDEPYVRYSGYLFASRQILGELYLRAPDVASQLATRRSGGIRRDLEFIRTYWQQYEGTAAVISERVNNRFIRTAGDQRGTAAYAASRNLIVLYARNNGGKISGTR